MTEIQFIYDQSHMFIDRQKIYLSIIYLKDMTTIALDQTVSELVKQDYRTAEVFKKWQLNFCCGGDISLQSICASKQLDVQQLTNELDAATKNISISSQIDRSKWEIDFLIDLIVHVHHNYIYEVLPGLKISLDAFALTHTRKFPELTRMTVLLDKLLKKITSQSRQEDETIFPYIRQIYAAYKRRESYGSLFVRTLRKPLQLAEKDQLEIDSWLQELKEMIANFTPTTNVCSSYQVQISKLQDLYDTLTQHRYLEQQYLFPRSIAIEQALLLQ